MVTKAPPTYPVCRFGGYLGVHMAEFVVGNIIARERKFSYIAQKQKEHMWSVHAQQCVIRTVITDCCIGQTIAQHVGIVD